MTCAIPAKDLAKRFLAKRFKETRAPGGVDPAARAGALLGLAGLLGPNGAGEDDSGADLRHAAPARTAAERSWPVMTS
ncbi:hypothetical protein [Streptomyces sp. NPDC001820]|uniref:hypothetical protein n=1 Tax=Streptomyces sp. NPDC001820 TaxID=3364613 RepID=UPI0036A45810